MISLNWLQKLLITACPERAAELSAIQLTDDDLETWNRLSHSMEMSSEQLFQFIQNHTHTPCADLTTINQGQLPPIKESVARRFNVIACGNRNRTPLLACTNPFDDQLNQEISFNLGHKVELLFAPPENIANAINLSYALQDQEGSRSLWISDDTLNQTASPDEAIERITLLILDEAVKKSASDIHIQSFLGGGLVRYRVDGQLIRGSSLPRKVQDSILRFIMNRAHLDTSNHSTPQDGRIQMRINNQAYDLRISILPSHDSQRLVIRLLNQSREFSMMRLGFPLAEQRALERLCQESRGFILFTGPTGSGKTTSLYTLLSSLNTPNKNIMTAEDPVEYRIPGISQIEVDEQRNRGFDTILKSMLRQDPDIILIGEIRDEQTLKTALQAVMTGHLVFATLHTTDIQGTIRRLLDLGATQGQLADSLKGIIAQRMARKLCSECATPIDTFNHLEQLFFESIQEPPAMRSSGCEHCNYTGYKQRFPLLEVYEPSQGDHTALRQERFLETTLSKRDRSMNVIATESVISGITSIDEITRILGADYWRDFNSLVMQDALSQSCHGLTNKQEPTLLLIGANPQLATEIEECVQYPVMMVNDADEAGAQLHIHAGLFAQLIVLHADDDIPSKLKLLRQRLAWAGLPTAFIVDQMTPGLKLLFEHHQITRWLTTPINADELISLTATLIEI
ncbi:GspE/PulE family protein [uncultured Neptuniibacter sp.]|uniref:GspE/PulE family protein n=1 Tax=uncultured Neptuniibacter sp. TaxID=502143 RepID=UPI00262B6CE0|nr:GspE/PulE family protein [uncultured Neptuniibacter sp.]